MESILADMDNNSFSSFTHAYNSMEKNIRSLCEQYNTKTKEILTIVLS